MEIPKTVHIKGSDGSHICSLDLTPQERVAIREMAHLEEKDTPEDAVRFALEIGLMRLREITTTTGKDS